MRLLAESVETFLAKLPEPDAGYERVSNPRLPAIDVEDEVEEDHPDRTLLWTQYRRHPISLGGKPFIDDDRFAFLCTRAIACGFDRVLEALVPDAEGQFLYPSRQNLVLKALIRGASALAFTPGTLCFDLAYHRDWLLRFLLAKSNWELEHAGDFSGPLQRFDERVDEIPGVVDILRRAIEVQCTGGEIRLDDANR